MSIMFNSGVDPDPNSLLDVLLPQIDDSMLRQIAAADYGQDVERHLLPLKLFRDERVIPILDWHPAEALELMRWSEPDQPNWKPGDVGTRGHLLRAFACSALLRAYARPENTERWHSFNETAIQLAESLKILGGPMVPTGREFFVWCMKHLGPLESAELEAPFLGLAWLSLVVADPTYTDDDSVVAMCMRIDQQVSLLLREKQWAATRARNWLLSTNCHDLKNHKWTKLGRTLSRWAKTQPPNEKSLWVALVGHALAED